MGLGLGDRNRVAVVTALCATSLLACSPSSPPSTERPLEDRLADVSEEPPIVERSPDGDVMVATGRIPAPSSVPADPVSRASWFMGEFGSDVGVDDPAEDLTVRDVTEGEAGSPEEGDAIVTYDRTEDGVPVFGGEVKVEVEADGSITTLISQVPADAGSISTTPSITEADAIARALAGLDRATARGAELMIFNEGMFTERRTPSRLAWRVSTLQSHVPAAVVIFVDALDGSIIGFQYNEMYDARHRFTYDAHGQDDHAMIRAMPDLVLNESGPVMSTTPDAQETLGHDTARTVWDYLWSHFGRDSHDGRGADMNTYTHYDMTGNNAYWWDGAMWFMDGMITLDIFGHEYTHGVVAGSCKLVYANDSGALNESLADTFGWFIDFEDTNIGEGSSLGIIRSMSDPTVYRQPRHVDGKTRLAAGDTPSDANDYGGVHGNSGIPNYAAYLATSGGTHPDSGIEVRGIGRDKAEQIYFRAMTWYMTSGASFAYAKIALRLAAHKFARRGMHGVTYEDCGSIISSWGAVGVGSPDQDSDCFADSVDNCPYVYNPDQRPVPECTNCANRTMCEGCTLTTGCVWCRTDAGMGACMHETQMDECMGELIEEQPMCAPMCGAEGGPCSGSGASFDDDCCEGLICVVGACRQPLGGREQASCDPGMADSCARGLSCRPVSTDTAAPTCCARDTDYCESKADCCGMMDCTANRCVGRTSGQSCVNGDCVGTSYCSGGTCT